MQQVAPTQNRLICHEVQQQVASVCVTGTGSPGHSSGCAQLAMVGSESIHLPTISHIGQSGGEGARLPMQENHSDYSGGPNMSWFWDLVAMSSQIPLSLPNLPNLLTAILIKSDNLNLHAGLLEPQQSRGRACLRQWQQEWRLSKGDQSDQSMRQVGHFYKVMYHSLGALRGRPCKVSC